MALTGNLKEFGMADILQLIGQQRKTGVLNIEEKDESIHVHFLQGSIIRAVSVGQDKEDLLGGILVRARIITQDELERALSVQKRTLKRLGDVLVAEKMIDRETFKEMHRLQTMETIIRLFGWKTGTYAFEQQKVDFDHGSGTSIDAEKALMEGFRIVDEWPSVREKVPSNDSVIWVINRPSEEDFKKGGFGDKERRVFELFRPGSTVQDIVDLSRLGEFEACNTLARLIDRGYLKTRAAVTFKHAKTPLGIEYETLARLLRPTAQLSLAVLVLLIAALTAYLAFGADHGGADRFDVRSTDQIVALHARARLENAIAVYRLEMGYYPDSLEDLVGSQLLNEKELKYPGSSEWFYRIAEDEPKGYLLLQPIP